MEANQVLELMDYFWFEIQIFRNKHELPSEFIHQRMDESLVVEKSTVQNLRIRSYSDRCIAVDFEAESPRSVIAKPRLQKIPSGEEAVFEQSFVGRETREKPRSNKRYGSRREKRGRSGLSRSLSALEFEELKGFRDLGFEFNEGETNPSIVSIVPGLQKWRKEEGGVSRPYLSEAWGDLSRRGDIVVNLRVPYGKNEMDMKDHIKVWAYVVASTLR